MKLKISRKKTENNENHFTLEGEMNIYNAKKIKDILLSELEASNGLLLNLAAVEETDTSAFQLLIFLKREALALDKKFCVTDMSDKLKSIFILYGENI
jgi:anti-anti-sigma factor